MIELAIENGISGATYNDRIGRLGWSKEKAATRPFKHKGDYAVYRKDELLVMGSRKECAEYLGVQEEYIHWMTTPSAIARRERRKAPEMAMTAIMLDDVDDE